MKIAVLILAALCAPAFSAPPLTPQQAAAIVGHCRCVMQSDVCIVETQRPMATTPLLIAGYGSVQPADANFLTLGGDSMCDAAETELAKNSTSPRSMVVRSRWRQSWVGPCMYPPKIQPAKKP